MREEERGPCHSRVRGVGTLTSGSSTNSVCTFAGRTSGATGVSYFVIQPPPLPQAVPVNPLFSTPEGPTARDISGDP